MAVKNETRRETERKATEARKTQRSAATVGKFRVLRGLHNEGGRTYRKGEVVESKYDLIDLYGRHKFSRVDSEDETLGLQRVTTASEIAASEKPRKGHDRPISAAPVDDDDVDDDEEDEEEDEDEEDSEVEDVTSEFKGAEEANISVQKENGTYYVFDSDDSPIGKKSGYTTKAEVKKLVKKHS